MPDTEKISYEVDPHNRLIVKKRDKVSGVSRFREILDGRFNIGSDNSLAYHIKKSANIDIPQQIKFCGNYSLEDDHSIVFTLNKWNNQVEGNRLIIKGQLLDAKDDELSFSVATRDASGSAKAYILKFGGAWRADEYNRLSFDITRGTGAFDNLTLQGAWQINDNNEIIYTRAICRLKTKEDVKNTLTFKGYWNIDEKFRISYVLNKQINSVFDFEIGFLKASQEGLEYKINIGVVPLTKIFRLFGEWKIDKRLGLLFEMPYEGKGVKCISFGATCNLSKKDTLYFKLKNNKHQDLDMDLKLSRKILEGQGEAFAQALKDGKEVSLLAGAGIRW
jgi:hypothetical protein